MVVLLHTQSPDDGALLPVVVDAAEIGVNSIRLFRASVEGSDRALNAEIAFDTSNGVSRNGEAHLFEVFVYVLAEEHVATMTDAMSITSWTDLNEPWDMATASAGGRVPRAVLVKTHLHRPETF